MNTEMTTISKELYDTAVSDIFTIQDAVRYLENEAKIRSLRDKLEKFSHGRDLRRLLVQGLLENDPQRKKDAVERRVRGWLADNGRISSIKKQDAIEVCFILRLSIEEADRFISMISEESLHYRNPDEIVYIFALQHGMSYREASELNRKMQKKLSLVQETKTSSEDSFTPLIRKEILSLQNESELEEYLEQAAGRLGRFHNCAYQEFNARLEMLKKSHLETDWANGVFEKKKKDKDSEKKKEGEDSEKDHLKIRDILREYLFEKNVLYAKEREREGKKKNSPLSEEEKLVFTKVQENICASWPDETTLSKMKSRKTDVTRKVLILLFLATDQGKDWSAQPEEYWAEPAGTTGTAAGRDVYGSETDSEMYQEYVYEDMDDVMTREEAFEDLYIRLNDMLSLCGFAMLDPRSPFDWLIIYCICVGDLFDADIRMHGIFREMFGERKEE